MPCLAIANTQGSVTPLPIADTRFFDVRNRKYQKIAQQGEVAFNLESGVAASATIAHKLGYVPKVRSFFHQTSATSRGMGAMFKPFLIYGIETRVTDTDLTFYLESDLSSSTVTGNMEYRIYYDE